MQGKFHLRDGDGDGVIDEEVQTSNMRYYVDCSVVIIEDSETESGFKVKTWTAEKPVLYIDEDSSSFERLFYYIVNNGVYDEESDYHVIIEDVNDSRFFGVIAYPDGEIYFADFVDFSTSNLQLESKYGFTFYEGEREAEFFFEYWYAEYKYGDLVEGTLRDVVGTIDPVTGDIIDYDATYDSTTEYGYWTIPEQVKSTHSELKKLFVDDIVKSAGITFDQLFK